MMRSALLMAVALALAATALAASSAKSPLKLALQASDMPANLHTTIFGKPRPQLQDPADVAILGVAGVRAADYTYSYPDDPAVKAPIGSSPKEWLVQGTVYVAPSPAKARALFLIGKPFRTGFFADVPGDAKDHVNVSLPSYGQDQTAVFVRRFPTVGPQAIVFVRKGSVVWELRARVASKKWNPSRAIVLAELKTYAAKQKKRVGSG